MMTDEEYKKSLFRSKITWWVGTGLLVFGMLGMQLLIVSYADRINELEQSCSCYK